MYCSFFLRIIPTHFKHLSLQTDYGISSLNQISLSKAKKSNHRISWIYSNQVTIIYHGYKFCNIFCISWFDITMIEIIELWAKQVENQTMTIFSESLANRWSQLFYTLNSIRSYLRRSNDLCVHQIAHVRAQIKSWYHIRLKLLPWKALTWKEHYLLHHVVQWLIVFCNIRFNNWKLFYELTLVDLAKKDWNVHIKKSRELTWKLDI